jgi:hypothetical protein
MNNSQLYQEKRHKEVLKIDKNVIEELRKKKMEEKKKNVEGDISSTRKNRKIERRFIFVLLSIQYFQFNSSVG